MNIWEATWNKKKAKLQTLNCLHFRRLETSRIHLIYGLISERFLTKAREECKILKPSLLYASK
jgi:hypothetical protein